MQVLLVKFHNYVTYVLYVAKKMPVFQICWNCCFVSTNMHRKSHHCTLKLAAYTCTCGNKHSKPYSLLSVIAGCLTWETEVVG